MEVLAALRLADRDTAPLQRLNDEEWRRTLDLLDRQQMTLLLDPAVAPAWAQERIAASRAANRERTRRVECSYREAAAQLRQRGLDFVLLKGFSQFPGFVPDLDRRVQYDLDLLLPPDQVSRARDALVELGYEALGREDDPTDHLPAMARKTGWQWRGDYFDPEIPVSIELHFRLWDERTEGFQAPGVERFWERRIQRQLGELSFTALDEIDALGYAALHALRHLLRGSLRMAHVYELAWFLDNRATDGPYWQRWRDQHPLELRTLETVVFRLARAWFGCRLPSAVIEIPQSDPVERWLASYALAPLEGVERPNKHELWLHLALINSGAAKVLRRRLFPMRLPGPVEAVYVAEEHTGWRLRWRKRVRYLQFLSGRVIHHARVLPQVAWHGLLFFGSRQSPEFWRFLASASLFNLGNFVFVVLYNLYLLELGMREQALGMITAAMTAGSLAGTWPAWRIARRFDLRAALLACFSATAAVSLARAWITSPPLLAGSAFLGGAMFSLWAVLVAPAVARLTNEAARPRAFSLFFAAGIATGVAGGFAGGRLPGWFGEGAFGYRMALATGCALMLLALWPARALRVTGAETGERSYPSGPFIRRFLVSVAVWSLAVGAFNPFFNAYFARRLGASAASIGSVYSFGQLAQVAAVLLAPMLLRRLGLVRGTAAMQIAAGGLLAALAAMPELGPAALCYAGYMAAQYMTEPGLYSMLMSRVPPHQRAGASALNFTAIFSANALAAAAAGWAFTRFGYPPVMAAAGGLAVAAGLLLARLLRAHPEPERAKDPA